MKNFIPIDFHCHGIGKFDFAEPDELVLDELERSLRIEGVSAILTLYLPKGKLPCLEHFVSAFGQGKAEGRYTHILGIAVEGPVLASFGGTPEKGCWHPTKQEWSRIAYLGQCGLVYVVNSPDAEFPAGDEFPESIAWVIQELARNGVRPALGHFRKDNPEKSAAAIETVCNLVKELGIGPIFTDHLFNDMPLEFKHAWRTNEDKARRVAELDAILSAEWNEENMARQLGPVPSTLIKFAKQGVSKICMNFDGDHVDIEICKKAVKLVGPENLMLMTDRIQSNVLGGQALHQIADNTLKYQCKGIVAGGTQSIMRQLGNMLSIGLTSDEILQIAGRTAATALQLEAAGTDTVHLASPVADINEALVLV